ncbi:MAG TPA: hypothetical protein DCE23_09000 [Firmicutes bacterium]|nr:hypothetical protein [Bacillota bacterium]
MNRLETSVLMALNKPGLAGKTMNIAEVIKEVSRIALSERDNDYLALSVNKGKDIVLNSIAKKIDDLVIASEDIKEKLKSEEFVIAKVKRVDDKTLEVVDVESLCTREQVSKCLEALEEKGLVYVVNGLYRAFPKDKGYIQGIVYFDENNNGIVYGEDGTYFINSFDLAGVLNEDLVVIVPSNKLRGEQIVAKINKVVRRSDGLMSATVVIRNGKKQIKADNKVFYYTLIIDDEELENYQEGDKLLVKVDVPKDKKIFAHVIRKLGLEDVKEESVISVTDDIEYTSEVEVTEINVLSTEQVKDLILLYINRNVTKSYSYNEIYRNVLRDVKDMSLKKMIFEKAIKELEENGDIVMTNGGLYKVLDKNCGFVQGKIKINKFNEGLVEDTEGITYLINTEDLCDALDGDIVLIKPTGKIKDGKVISKVERIIKRKDGLVVVEVSKNNNGEYYLRPFNATLAHPIKINNYSMKPLVEGDRILVKIDELTNDECYYAGFIKNIGHKDDPDADLQVIAIQNDIVVDFSKEALDEADRIPTEVLPEEKVGRLDLTDKLIYSIDGASTKDRDDAISIEVLDNGNYRVGVHIADVSHYVHPGMKLWDEALRRGTSVYMIDTVIPMIPHKLSNGICSLNEGVDRLAFSCIMEVTPKGQIISYDFVDTLINSRKAMTYEAVNEIFEEGNVPEGYEEFYDNLVLMKDLSDKLERIKERRGYINFGTNDLEIVRDEEGKPLSFKQRQQRTAEKIIENLMLLAGECYATYMVIPTPLRVHEKPDEDKVEEAFDLLEKSGIKVKSCQEIVNGKVLQQVLKQIESEDERVIAANILLRSMKRARYDINEIGHFGLGLNTYGHWTSPIRRAADLRGHYNLRIQRDNMGYIKDFDKFTEEMESFCYHISRTERNADNAEQEANEYEMVKYVLSHLGEKFECHVTFISPRVIFVKTIDGIDGKILTENIKGDSFRFNDRAFAFVGKKSKKRIKIGTQLIVTAIDADHDFGSVAFGIEEDDLKLIKGRNKRAV